MLERSEQERREAAAVPEPEAPSASSVELPRTFAMAQVAQATQAARSDDDDDCFAW